MKNNEGILFFGQSLEMAGRGISGARLRTAAQRVGYNVKIIDYVGDLTSDQIQNEVVNPGKFKEELKRLSLERVNTELKGMSSE